MKALNRERSPAMEGIHGKGSRPGLNAVNTSEMHFFHRLVSFFAPHRAKGKPNV